MEMPLESLHLDDSQMHDGRHGVTYARAGPLGGGTELIESHGGGSCRSKAVYVAARAVIRPTLELFPVTGPLSPLISVVEHGFRVVPRHRGVEHDTILGEGWHAELIRPKDHRPGTAAVVYFHGGAFLMCGVATHRRIAERIALDTGVPVLSVAYRQRPTHFVETSVADGVAAVNWLLAEGYDASRLVLAGDSAGGHLSFAVAMAAAEQGIQLGGVVALSPWLDFDNTERRVHRNAWRDALIPTFRLERIAEHVLGTRSPDPLRSPVNGAVTGLPPTLIVASRHEVLLADAEKMEQRLREAGVPVELHVWDGQVHAFPVLTRLLPESRAALALVCDFVLTAVGDARSRRVADIAS